MTTSLAFAAVIFGWVMTHDDAVSPIAITVSAMDFPRGDSFMYNNQAACDEYLSDRLVKMHKQYSELYKDHKLTGKCTKYEFEVSTTGGKGA
jgi:hypothetical protein